MKEYRVRSDPQYTVNADGFYIDHGVLIFYTLNEKKEKELFMSFNKDEWEVVSQQS